MRFANILVSWGADTAGSHYDTLPATGGGGASFEAVNDHEFLMQADFAPFASESDIYHRFKVCCTGSPGAGTMRLQDTTNGVTLASVTLFAQALGVTQYYLDVTFGTLPTDDARIMVEYASSDSVYFYSAWWEYRKLPE